MMARTPVLIVLLALVTAGSTSSQTPPPSGEALSVHPEAEAAIDRLKSPYCPGMMLAVCTSAGGAMLRDSIQSMAESGLSSDSIVELIVAEYGEQWRAEPLRSGAGLWAWLLPPVAIIVGLAGVAVILARRRGPGPEPGKDIAVTEDDERRLRKALEELEEEEEPVF
jgi:cytochrome c-type biogenesis protein CcmH/NrfF